MSRMRVLRRAAILAGSLMAMAPADHARADCSIGSFERTQLLVTNFMFQQDSLMREFPRGGDAMRYRVSVIAASSKASLPIIMRLVRTGNVEQRQATGGGLAIAAKLCDRKQQSAAARMIERTAKSYNDPAFLREFEKSYKSRDDVLNEVEEALRAQTLRQQMIRPAQDAGPDTALGRSIRTPLDGHVAPVAPIQATRPITR